MPPSRRSILRLGVPALAGTAGCLGAFAPAGAKIPGPDGAPDALRWAYETAGDVRHPPAVTDDAVYVPSGQLFALGHDGTKRWSVETADGVTDTPEVADCVYFVDRRASWGRRDDAVRAVEFDGSERWTFEPGGSVDLLGVAGDRAYVNTTSDYSAPEGFKLYAVNVDTGDREWTAEVGAPSEIAIRGDSVYVVSDRAVRAFATDGHKRWERRVDADSLAGVRRGTVVAGGLSSVTALDADDGSDRWTVSDEDGAVTDTVVRGDTVYVAEYDTVSALDFDGGDRRWRSAIHDGKHYYLGAVTDETVYTSGGEGAAAVNAEDGTERWTWADGNSAIYAEKYDDTVYVSGDQRVAAVGTDGEERWRFRAHGDDAVLFRPSVSGAGGYVGSDDGIVYAFET